MVCVFIYVTACRRRNETDRNGFRFSGIIKFKIYFDIYKLKISYKELSSSFFS